MRLKKQLIKEDSFLMLKNSLFLCCIFLVFFKSYSQDLQKHRWKNRVVLIFSDSKDDEKLQNQINILSKEKEGLAEMKLLIYRFSQGFFTTNFNTIWFSSTLKIRKYKKKSEDFKIVLIGLDGGIKMKQTTLLSAEKLFAIIDGMPMRRSELRNNKN
ncbi:hypothetical protein BTO18_17140 [Polaribacter porphyrae]|uniref:DUF4174 domain-containing protein n=1 Tax=Polaribacter porphyrae TaxID=1137780 RepID=A0A2S7WTZ8_9FLAO|nr:hypothetical protein BTO18_17140 [Polaribacter porphyrae]